MSMSLGSQGKISAEINVTPMIDVLLVLIIIFLVVLPHHWVGEKVEIPQPSKDIIVPNIDDTIVIQLHDTGESQRPVVRINQREVKWEELEATLKDIYTLRMDKVAFLQGDPEVDFQYVADVVDVTHHAGVLRVGLMDAKN
jgi:biopolymer transport protein TolR